MLFDSGRFASPHPDGLDDAVPAIPIAKTPARPISELNHTALVSAVYASSDASLRPHARLASGRWLAFAGRASNPLDSNEKFQSATSDILLSQAYPGATESKASCGPTMSSSKPGSSLRVYCSISPSSFLSSSGIPSDRGCAPFVPASRPPSWWSLPLCASASRNFSWITQTAISSRNSSSIDRTRIKSSYSVCPGSRKSGLMRMQVLNFFFEMHCVRCHHLARDNCAVANPSENMALRHSSWCNGDQ